jgi:integrase
MPLSDARIRGAKAYIKPQKMFDEKGLFLLVKPNGSRYWHHKYRFAGKEKLISYGTYPEVSLAEARSCREESRRLLRENIDPSAFRKASAAALNRASKNTFSIISAEWYQKQLPKWANSTAKKRKQLLDNDLNGRLGTLPIENITTHELLSVLQRIEDRGAIDTAHNALQVLSQIFRYAKQSQRIDANPAVDLKGALRPISTSHRAAIIEPRQLGDLLLKIENYSGTLIVKRLLQLCPILFQRPGEMISAKWSEIDMDEAIWKIPAEKMKMGIAHEVPLPEQAIELLKDLNQLTSHREYVFPNARNPRNHASAATINSGLRKLGIDTKAQHCAHGFRATARTLLDEKLNFRIEWIEQQLAHQVRDSLGRAYNRTKHLPQRVEMMQQWANYLDELKLQAAAENKV